MTCCVAALCDQAKSIILVSDKMVGMGMIEGQPDIMKVFWLHKDWRLMIAGDDIAPAFPIVDDIRAKLGKKSVSVSRMMKTAYECYRAEREGLAEAIHLAPLGWTMKQFNSPQASAVLQSSRKEIATKLANQRLEVDLIVAGFDDRGKGHVFSLEGYDGRGRPSRHDIPGYHAIGSGAVGATYMMAYREVSSSMPLRLVLYYAIEGKFFGERAGGVGTRTDAFIMRAGEQFFRIKEKVLEDNLFKLCERLKPRELNQSHIKILNELPGDRMGGIPKIERIKKEEDWVIQTQTPRRVRDPEDPSA